MRERAAQKKRTTARWLLFFVFIFALLGLYVFRQVTHSVFWQKQRVTLVLKTDPVVVISLPGNAEEAVTVVTVPSDVYVTVPHGYGPYRMEAVWKLEELEKRPQLVVETMSDLFGVVVSKWIQPETTVSLADDEPASLVKDLKAHFSWDLVFNHYATNLSWLDRWFLGLQLARKRNDAFTVFMTHKNSRLFVNAQLVDKTQVKMVNEAALDQFLEQKLEDAQIRKENTSVTVINATGTPLVGHKFSRYLKNIGSNVIALDSKEASVPACEVSTHDEVVSAIVSYMVEKLHCAHVTNADITGSEVEVLVGDLYAERWPLNDGVLLEPKE